MTITRASLALLLALLHAAPGWAAAAPTAPTPPLGAVVIQGATALPASTLFAAYRAQLGGAITRDCALAITDALTGLYERDGYVRPELAVDGSFADDGVLRVTVYEARVTRVLYEGNPGPHAAALERIGSQLAATAALRREDIPAALREMRAFAGLSVSATTRRDANRRNGHELVVQADYAPVEGLVRINNRGTEQAGPVFLLGQLTANGVVGRQGKLGLVFAAASDPGEYLGGGIFLDAALGADGTRANLLLFRSRSEPNEAPVNLDDRYTRERATLRVARPLAQSSTASLSTAASLELDELSIHRAGSRIRQDRLRVIEAALRGSWRGAGAMQYAAGLELRRGLDALGAGLDAPDLTENPRRADFTLARMQATAYRRFATRWSARLDAFAQYTNQVLPDTERFKIGGDRLGRGFEVAEIAGDRGVGAKIELRRALFDGLGLLGDIATYGFYDHGTAWKQGLPGREQAATAGLGLAMSGATLTGYLEVTTPLQGPDIEGQRDASVFAEFSWHF